MKHHVYLSTACAHERHDECRERCKFCDEPCYCRCHTTKVDEPPSTMTERES